MWIFFYLAETYHLVKTYGSEEEERRQWQVPSAKRNTDSASPKAPAIAHDDARGAFVTPPPYTSSREGEVSQLCRGPKLCREGL